MKLEKEQIEKIVLAVIGAIIVLIALIYFVLEPNIRHIRSLRIEIREQKNKVLDAEMKAGSLNRATINIKNEKEQINKYQAEIPQATADWFLSRLNRLAKLVGIDFDRIEPQGYISVQVEGYRLQKLNLKFRAGYHKLGMFINELEKSSPFIRILNLTITGNKDDTNKNNIRLDVGAFVVIKQGKENKE